MPFEKTCLSQEQVIVFSEGENVMFCVTQKVTPDYQVVPFLLPPPNPTWSYSILGEQVKEYMASWKNQISSPKGKLA